jgi:hypothetical protein
MNKRGGGESFPSQEEQEEGNSNECTAAAVVVEESGMRTAMARDVQRRRATAEEPHTHIHTHTHTHNQNMLVWLNKMITLGPASIWPRVNQPAIPILVLWVGLEKK